MAEEFIHLRKSKPVVLAAGIIWAMIAYVYASNGFNHEAEIAVRHNLLEYAELMLFLLVAMTYINAMQERQAFDALRSWLCKKGYGFRQLFWITGVLAFFISPIADNLTTALLMCAVVMAVGGTNNKFILIAAINIVVAANAGGAFSPFGDITTLMVWQKSIEASNGSVDFFSFFALFVPSLVNWLVPAAIMHFSVPNEKPDSDNEAVEMKRGAKRIIALFICTIATAVSFHNFLHLPPVIGMLTGLAYLKFFGFYLKKTHFKEYPNVPDDAKKARHVMGDIVPFDVFDGVSRAEWDTLLFFYGVVSLASELMYTEWGSTMGLSAAMNATPANVVVGILSAIVDNIPVMFGVALMGAARGKYTFFGHLKWAPVIMLGYAASIATHMWINSALF